MSFQHPKFKRKRVIAPNDPVSMTQPGHKTDAAELLRDYARGIPVPGRALSPSDFGSEDVTLDRAKLERMRVQAKDLDKAVKKEFEANEREKQKREQQQREQQTTAESSPDSASPANKSARAQESENQEFSLPKETQDPSRQQSPGSARKRGV